MTAGGGGSGMGSAPDEQEGSSQSIHFGVHPPFSGVVREGNRALTRRGRVGASSLSSHGIAGGETPNLTGGTTMIRTLLALAAGIGVGAGVMNAAHHRDGGENVKV